MSAEIDTTKGKAEQAIGDLTGDKDMRRKGKVDEAAGKVKDAVEGVVDNVKDKLRRD